MIGKILYSISDKIIPIYEHIFLIKRETITSSEDMIFEGYLKKTGYNYIQNLIRKIYHIYQREGMFFWNNTQGGPVKVCNEL